MPWNDIAKVKSDLDDLSDRIERRRQELVENGVFLDEHAALVRSINDRQSDLRARVDVAISRGKPVELIRTEFARDYDAVLEQFRLWVERTDASLAKDIVRRVLSGDEG